MSEKVVDITERRTLRQDREFVLNYSKHVQSIGTKELRAEIDQLIVDMAPSNPPTKEIFLKGQILLSELETRYDRRSFAPNPITSLITEVRNKLSGLQPLS